MEYTLVCPCIFGLEKIVDFELKRLGAKETWVENGRVTATGDALLVARANLGLRCAERVLLQLAQFPAPDFDRLFDGVKRVEWEEFIPQNGAFPVKGWCLNSALTSVPRCQSIIKKAVVEKLKSAYQVNWFEETGEQYQIQFSIHKDMATIYMDTSGEGLHKRGYRKNGVDAPLKETLAAGICDLARLRGEEFVIDPVCGSGTLLIEAAMRAMNIAPGLNRTFACEKWTTFPKEAFREARGMALDAIDKTAAFSAQGYDIDPGAVELTMQNAKLAGVGGRVSAAVADVRTLKPARKGGTLLANPPYGERMLSEEQAREVDRAIGELCKNGGYKAYIITPSEHFEVDFGRRANRRRKLYNGELQCQLYMYF